MSKLKTNHIPILRKNTWWKDTMGRTWVVLSISYDGLSPAELKPYKVELLEFTSTDPIERPWEEICNYIDKNIFTPI